MSDKEYNLNFDENKIFIITETSTKKEFEEVLKSINKLKTKIYDIDFNNDIYNHSGYDRSLCALSSIIQEYRNESIKNIIDCHENQIDINKTEDLFDSDDYIINNLTVIENKKNDENEDETKDEKKQNKRGRKKVNKNEDENKSDNKKLRYIY